MKKKMLIGTLSAALLFGGAFAVGATNNDNASKIENKDGNEETVTNIDEIKKIALQKVEGGVIEDIELEQAIYKVDIEKDSIDYDLYIDAYSGEIYSVDRDDEIRSNSDQTNTNGISKADATAIAEKAVNGKMVEIDKDEDDGFIKYEVELTTERGEAEVHIDASTGKVLDVEWNN